MWRWLTLALARIRHAPLRSSATVLGVAAVAALGTAALHLDHAGRHLASSTPGEPLITMQAGRICPSTSHLPWDAGQQIAAVDGVAAVLPQQVVVSDCKVSVSAVTFRGVDPGAFLAQEIPRLDVIDGDPSAMASDSTAALVGRQVARARSLTVGDTFENSGVSVQVAAIVDGPRMQDRASIWVDRRHLEAVYPALREQATLFELRPQPGVDGEALALAIDTALGGVSHTAPFSATAARVTGSLAETLRGGGAVALAAVVAGIALLINASILALRAAGRDLAVLRAIGHPLQAVLAVTGVEALLVGLFGALLGATAAAWLVVRSATAISTEGVSVVIGLQPQIVILVVAVALLVALLTALLPTWWVARGSARQALGGGG